MHGSRPMPGFFQGGGEMGTLIRAHDWSATPLGPIEAWPQSLRTAVDIMLVSPKPTSVLWGPERVQLYNDAYIPIAAERHPAAFGRSAAETWAEAFLSFLGPILDRVSIGEAVEIDEHAVTLRKPDGGFEERFFTGSFLPVRDETGAVGGVLHPLTEVTAKVRADANLRESEARLAFLDRLGTETAPLADADAVLATTTRLLGEYLNLSVCAYADMDEDQNGFTIRGDWAALGSRSIVGHYHLADFGQLAVKNLSAGLPLVVNDNRRELAPGEAATFQSIGITATICMPLVKEGRLTALMAIHDRVPRVWTEAELALLREVTARSWVHVERIAAIAELRESEARLRRALEVGHMVVWDHDLATGHSHRSANAAALLGIGAGPADDFYDLVNPSDSRRVAELRDAAIRGEADYEAEFRVLAPGGREIWVVDRAHVERDTLGHPVRMLGVVADVTARKNAELAAATAATEFRALAENVSQLAWMAQPDGHIFWYNKRWYDYTGTTFEQMQGWGWREVHHPDHIELVIEEVRGKWAKGEAWEGTYLLKSAQGEYRWFLTRAEPIRNETGELIRWFGTNTDITAQREAEEGLRELNDTLEARVAEALAERKLWADVFESSDALIGALAPDHRFLAMNKAYADEFERIYGVRPKVGDSLGEILASKPEERAAALAIWDRALAGEEFVITEAFGDPKRDRPYYELRFNTLRDRDGKRIGAFQYAVDVSERLRTQAKLAEAEEALRQSQKMEAMGQLTGGVAHDFNNLLTPIVGSLDMLQRKGLGGEREQRLIAGAMQSAERAKTLVQRLLAFARRQPLQPTAVDVGMLVAGMADLLASTSGPQIKLVVDIAPDLPAAVADPNQLEMALLNLGVNARDAMPEGGTLRVSADLQELGTGHRARLRPGRYIHLSVADTGVGMDEATLARAVEPFFSTKGIGKGTGLGLSMVHGLASQLGGALTIQSRPSVGTNIELWLPVSVAPAEVADRTGDSMPAPAAKGTALLVDDEELVRMSTADMLSDLGYAVVEAASAEEALRLLHGGLQPDLLVTDHLMPGMNGTDLAHAVRAERPGTQVLIVSGYAEAEGIAPDLPRLTKPFRNADLTASLATLGVTTKK